MLIRLAPLLVLVLAAPGCGLCSNCYDDAYGYYGGCTPRHDQFCGRVGSAFTPGAGAVRGVAIVEEGPIEEVYHEARAQRERTETAWKPDPLPYDDEQPSLPEPADRPPAATGLENTLRTIRR